MTDGFACFVTGTDTEIGKTLISSALLHALAQAGVRAAGMKPVAAGAELVDGVWHNDDVDSIAAAGNVDLPRELTTPYLFRDPIAPHIAAQRENVAMRLEHILACRDAVARQCDALVVEGVGGFCVPLAPEFDTAELARRLALPVVLVVGMRLGCISHAVLTAEAIRARGLVLAGWVANTVDPNMPFRAENVQTLRELLPVPLLGQVPRLDRPDAASASRYLDVSLLPGWPARQGA